MKHFKTRKGYNPSHRSKMHALLDHRNNLHFLPQCSSCYKYDIYFLVFSRVVLVPSVVSPILARVVFLDLYSLVSALLAG